MTDRMAGRIDGSVPLWGLFASYHGPLLDGELSHVPSLHQLLRTAMSAEEE